MNWLRKLFQKSDYVRLLEEERVRLLAEVAALRVNHWDEVERFRATISALNKENRNLVNSLLGTAGISPMTEEARQATPTVRRRSWHQLQNETERETTRKAMERTRGEEERSEVAKEATPAGQAKGVSA